MAVLGDEAGVGEHSDSPGLCRVDDDCVPGLAVQDEGNQAVITHVGVLHGAVVATDDDRFTEVCIWVMRSVSTGVPIDLWAAISGLTRLKVHTGASRSFGS
jgi:hypothetical protein